MTTSVHTAMQSYYRLKIHGVQMFAGEKIREWFLEDKINGSRSSHQVEGEIC